MPSGDRVLNSLRFALRHLYDVARLRTSPLIDAFGLAERADPSAELRQTLIQIIRSLQPGPEMPADTQAWRVYEILYYRYVQRCSQFEVAEQLGLSTRHLARLERNALQVLAGQIEQQTRVVDENVEPALGMADVPLSLVDDEVSWLGSPPPEEAVDLIEVLPSVIELARPMASQHGITLAVEPLCDEEFSLAVHHVALRQILLSLLSVAIRQASDGPIAIQVSRKGWEAEIGVRSGQMAQVAVADQEEAENVAASLEMVRRLAATSGGRLEIGPDGEPFMATVALPMLEQLPVLVIDDNVNTLRLLQRYVSNTRYRITGVQTMQEGLAIAQELPPRIIVLDVMMPDIDGWEALGRLRQHPVTSHVPVIICTIIAEEELALSLGASGFLRKPVSRENFLSALDHQVDRAAPESD